MICKICGGQAARFMSAFLLGKYSVSYFRCTRCGFVQTEEPYWLAEAYSSAIAELDIGLISRNELSAGLVQAVTHRLFNRKGPFLDYGGGYGILVRMLRDRGYDFYRYDTYCDNIFARHFDLHDLPGNHPPFRLVTAFEVFEHLVQPVDEVRKIVSHSRSILFSTQLQPSATFTPATWWYVLPETGQHVALYSRRSLQVLGEQFGLHYYEGNNHFHLLTDERVNPRWFSALTDWRFAKVYNLITRSRQTSLLNSDLQMLRLKLSHAHSL